MAVHEEDMSGPSRLPRCLWSLMTLGPKPVQIRIALSKRFPAICISIDRSLQNTPPVSRFFFLPSVGALQKRIRSVHLYAK